MKLSAAQQRTVDALVDAANTIDNYGLCPPDLFHQNSKRDGRYTIPAAIRLVVTGHDMITGEETPTQQDTVVRAIQAFSRVAGEAAGDFGEWPEQTTRDAVLLLRAASMEVGA